MAFISIFLGFGERKLLRNAPEMGCGVDFQSSSEWIGETLMEKVWKIGVSHWRNWLETRLGSSLPRLHVCSRVGKKALFLLLVVSGPFWKVCVLREINIIKSKERESAAETEEWSIWEAGLPLLLSSVLPFS